MFARRKLSGGERSQPTCFSSETRRSSRACTCWFLRRQFRFPSTYWTTCGRSPMPLLRSPCKKSLWKEEFSVFTSDERYVTRRQFTKFLTLASLGMFVGNLWILAKAYFTKTPSFRSVEVGKVGEIPVRGIKLF